MGDSIFGNIFPDETENIILNNAASAYYQFSEDSFERNQLIEQAVDELIKINPRWDFRKVRIWIINNGSKNREGAQVYSNSDTESSPLLKPPVHPTSVPPKKRMAYSKSAQVSRAQSPGIQYIQNEYTISQHNLPIPLTVEEQRANESTIATTIQNSINMKFVENLSPMCGWPIASSMQTLPSSISPFAHLPLVKTSEYASVHQSYKEPTNIPPEYIQFFKGPKTLESQEFQNIEVAIPSAGGTQVVIEYDASTKAHVIHHSDKTCPFESNFPATSATYDPSSSSIFIASGNCISQMSIQSGTLMRNIIIGKSIIPRSCLTLCGPNLVLGVKNHLLTIPQSNVAEIEEGGTAEITPSAIPCPVTRPTAICPSGPFLAVASSNAAQIFLVDQEGSIGQVLIGHQGGVTSMSRHSDALLVTGSADSTAKLWDIRVPFPVMQLQRHLGPISAVCSDQVTGIVVTGGYDHKVRAWDTRNALALYEVHCGAGAPIAMDLASAVGRLTVVTKGIEETVADGLGLARTDDGCAGLGVVSPNLIIEYGFFDE